MDSQIESQSNTSDSNSSIDIQVLIDNLLLIDWEKIKNYQQTDKSVVNLSSHFLTPSQGSLLKKGLTFCPMPGETDVAELKNDLYKFERNLKWKLHWAKRNLDSGSAGAPVNNNGTPLITVPQDTNTFEHRKFKNKSKAEAPVGTPNIETLFHLAHRELDNFVPKRTKFQNLTKEENQAILSRAICRGAPQIRWREDCTMEMANNGWGSRLTTIIMLNMYWGSSTRN